MNISICLLADNAGGDFPTWVQAGCAMITLMLVIMGLLQNKRIQELVEIVKELKNQTAELKTQSEVLTKRYDLERRLSLKDRVPYFEKRDFYRVESLRHTLFLKNSGIDCMLVNAKNIKYEGVIADIHVPKNVDIRSSQTFDINVFTQADMVDTDFLTFSFTLTFFDGKGNPFKQDIRCEKGFVIIESPVGEIE
jgi:hypothetical protein